MQRSKRSIKNKLLFTYLVTIILALSIAGAAFIIQEIYSIKDTLTKRIAIQSKIIVSNATVAILFKDRESTDEILKALQADQEILSVNIRKDNAIFSHYTRQQRTIANPSWILSLFLDPLITLNEPIIYKNKKIAEIEIISDYPTLHEHIKRYGLIASIVLLTTFFISFMIAKIMQRSFLTPIMQLLTITKKVAKNKKYNFKVPKTSDDELGLLAEHFNIMLEQINERDQNLEAEVASRTTELISLNKTLNYRASHDTLTQLANRELFNEQVHHAIAQAERQQKQFAILFLDLDHFKLINDTMGHEFGDIILQETAKKLASCIRKVDTLARMGGDEFTILLDQILEPKNIVSLVEKILLAFSSPITVENFDFHVKASIGISIYPEDGKQADILQKNADTAMYSAKAEGGNRYHFFSTKMSERVHQRMTLESELHKALVKNQFLLYYQPQINQFGDTVSFEALLRWFHPTKGMISPNEFIPVAEETGQITDIGQWVVNQACKQQIQWHDQGYPIIPIHINISPKQFLQPNLANSIQTIIQNHGLSNDLIGCEITENTFALDFKQSTTILNQLNQFGFHLSIDDFGTGYSSLGYLKSFPINSLKIDQSFIREMTQNSKEASLVCGIINLAHSLDLSIIAEGVESAEQRDFLIQNQCDLLQGYFYSKPLPANEAIAWLETNENRVIRI